ncbi:hypothetical protein [Zunongwangia sp.]
MARKELQNEVLEYSEKKKREEKRNNMLQAESRMKLILNGYTL